MVATALKARGEIPLASLPVEAKGLKTGDRWCVDGVIIKYRNQDLAALEEKFDKQFFNDAVLKILNASMSFEEAKEYLNAGTKKDGVPYIVPENEIDDIPVFDIQDVILEALCRAYRGIGAIEFCEIYFGIKDKDGDVKVDDLPPSKNPTTTTSQI